MTLTSTSDDLESHIVVNISYRQLELYQYHQSVCSCIAFHCERIDVRTDGRTDGQIDVEVEIVI